MEYKIALQLPNYDNMINFYFVFKSHWKWDIGGVFFLNVFEIYEI